MKPPDVTPAERAALKQALLEFKHFWNSISPARESEYADRLIDAVIKLAKEMDK